MSTLSKGNVLLPIRNSNEYDFNPLNANFTKWSNTFKQIAGNLPTNCLSVFDHFVGLVLKGLKSVQVAWIHLHLKRTLPYVLHIILLSWFFFTLNLGTHWWDKWDNSNNFHFYLAYLSGNVFLISLISLISFLSRFSGPKRFFILEA